LGRTIQEYIKKALAEELLFGKLAKGGTVLVGVKDDELTFDFRSAAGKDAGAPSVPELA
jgi:ATP-dependent Clp protease ATP-binding subunit ClpA